MHCVSRGAIPVRKVAKGDRAGERLAEALRIRPAAADVVREHVREPRAEGVARGKDLDRLGWMGRAHLAEELLQRGDDVGPHDQVSIQHAPAKYGKWRRHGQRAGGTVGAVTFVVVRYLWMRISCEGVPCGASTVGEGGRRWEKVGDRRRS